MPLLAFFKPESPHSQAIVRLRSSLVSASLSTETGSLHLRLVPYHDPLGYPTICYGHLLSRERHADLGRWVLLGNEAEARKVLA